MRATTSTRRALGVLAVSAIGMSTLLLSTASAASASEGDLSGAIAGAVSGPDTIPAGTCAAHWIVLGGIGDTDADPDNGLGGLVIVTTLVTPGDTYTFTRGSGSAGPGLAGEDSSVTGPSSFSIVARGGTGDASTRAANTVAGPAAASIDPDTDYNGMDDGSLASETMGDGFSGAVPIACPTAPADVALDAGDGSADISFPSVYDDDEEDINDASGYQYKIGSGGTWQSMTEDQDTGDVTATATGLVDGTSYDVFVRTTSTVGPSDVVAAGSVTPYAPLPAPTNVVLTAGVSSMTVTWDAPPAGGTFPIAGYDVGWGGENYGNQACDVDASVHTCSFGLPAGQSYTVGVAAVDSQGNFGLSTNVPTGVISGPSVPATLPTQDDGDVRGPAGPISQAAAGQTLTLEGDGYLPDSTVELAVYSSPISLGSVVVDSTGHFSIQVTIPTTLASGPHHLVAAGVDVNGNPRYLVTAITVSNPNSLAYTGADTSGLLTGGGVALLAGVGLMVASRRRRTTV